MILPSQKSFSKHQNKDKIKNLDDSEVLSSDFLGPRTSAASLTSLASTAYFTKKKLPDPDDWIIPGTKMTNLAPFCEMDHKKSNVLLISYTLSVGGC